MAATEPVETEIRSATVPENVDLETVLKAITSLAQKIDKLETDFEPHVKEIMVQRLQPIFENIDKKFATYDTRTAPAGAATGSTGGPWGIVDKVLELANKRFSGGGGGGLSETQKLALGYQEKANLLIQKNFYSKMAKALGVAPEELVEQTTSHVVIEP